MVSQDFLFKVALIGALGIGSQWAAWRLKLPAIVLMALAGILAGPVTGLLDPVADFGALLRPMIAVGVAVILFEGGLSLNLGELRDASLAVRRLVFPGVAISWAAGAMAAHYLAGLEWPVAVLLAGILVVTGPTVIGPLLRQAKLPQRPSAILKWEGIINDPIGALLAVLVFEYMKYAEEGRTLAGIALWMLAASAAAIAIGLAVGLLLIRAFRRGQVPEFLKAPLMLCAVLVCLQAADRIEHETGLVAVTVLGVVMANSKLAGIADMRRFKEYVSVLFVSGIFVVLTATLTFDVVYAVDRKLAGFLLAILFVVRPLTVWVSTLGAGLGWRERLLIGWVAPRGIVAVAVSGFFATELTSVGYAQGQDLVPISFAVVFATVVAHGFTVGPLARRLGLTSTEAPGVLIVGSSPWSVAFASVLKKMEVPVCLADTSWRRLRPARLAGLPIYYGEILSEVTEHRLDINRFGYLAAVTGNEAYNSLVCTELGPELGRNNVFQLGDADADDPRGLASTIRGRSLFRSGVGLDDLLKRHYGGWTFKQTNLSERYDVDDYTADRSEDNEIVLVRKKSGALLFSARPAQAEIDDTIVAFGPPLSEERA